MIAACSLHQTLAGDVPAFIDWQYTAVGKGCQDIVFFLIEGTCSGIPTIRMARHHPQLVRLRGIIRAVVASFQTCWHPSLLCSCYLGTTLLIADCGLRIVDCRLPIADCRLCRLPIVPTADCGLRIARSPGYDIAECRRLEPIVMHHYHASLVHNGILDYSLDDLKRDWCAIPPPCIPTSLPSHRKAHLPPTYSDRDHRLMKAMNQDPSRTAYPPHSMSTHPHHSPFPDPRHLNLAPHPPPLHSHRLPALHPRYPPY